MNIIFRILLLLIISVNFDFESSTQIEEYSPYECYDDWMLKFEEFSTITEEHGSTFLDSRPLEWVKRCIGYENRDPNDKDHEYGRTALHYLTTYFGAMPAMEYMLSNGADIEAQDKQGVRPLGKAIYINAVVPDSYLAHITDHVKFLLEKGANPNSQDSFGFSPLHYATAKNYTGVMRLLIDYNANVNIANKANIVPIHFAAANASPLAAKILLDSGAKVNIQTESKLRFSNVNIDYVMNQKFYEGRDSEIGDIPGSQSPLHIVATYERFRSQYWVDDKGEPTKLAAEFMKYHRDTCRLLVKAGGNVHLRNAEGKTASELASYLGNKQPKEEWEKVLSRSSRECAEIFSTERKK